jgi:hypothetical protein
MHLFDDRCEFRRFKKKPFHEILRDIFISETGILFLILVIVWVVLYVYQSKIVWSLAGVIIYSFSSAIVRYYKQHRDVTLLISDILKFSVIRNNSILNIEYCGSDGIILSKTKTVDMPDTDAERQYVIDKLDEISTKQVKANKLISEGHHNTCPHRTRFFIYCQPMNIIMKNIMKKK